MKQLRCRDLGKSCRFVARGRTVRSVMTKAAKHARSRHRMTAMSAAMRRRVRRAIKTV